MFARGHKEMSSMLADQYSALVYEPKCEGVAGSQAMSAAVHMSPNKPLRSNFTFNYIKTSGQTLRFIHLVTRLDS
jgi:hypothetical protein